jgi:hypothetical protein
MAVSPVLIASRSYQAQLARYESAATGRLIDNYLKSWGRLEGLLNKLLLDIGPNIPTRGRLVRMERYKALMSQIVVELNGLQTMTGNEIAGVGDLIAIGEQHARELMALQIAGRTQVAGMFNVLPREAIQTVLGFLAPDGPLYARLVQLTGVNAQAVADAIAQAITLGWNPRKTAAAVRGAFGRGLADALRFVRTAQLWTYREANRASMVVNQDVLDGWVWNTNFDKRTCMSCVVMHGTIHPVEEVLNDHHNGRCVAIPLVKGFTPVIQETGIEWFEKQSEATQRAMMGREYYHAWKGGAYQLSEMTTVHRDEVYGDMRTEARLWQLLGAEPPVRVGVMTQ